MAIQATQERETRVSFREIPISSTSIFISNIGANHQSSMEHLAKHNLRPLTYQEALVNLMKNPELKEQLKGKWFYLDGVGIDKSELHTIDEQRNLVKGKGASPEETVRVWKGQNPLSLLVNSDDFTADNGRRFYLDADFEPSNVAPVVVGVKVEQKVEDCKQR